LKNWSSPAQYYPQHHSLPNTTYTAQYTASTTTVCSPQCHSTA